MAEHTLAPKVTDKLRGAIRVRDLPVTWGDASGLLRMPGRR
jgi:hypothetical protein